MKTNLVCGLVFLGALMLSPAAFAVDEKSRSDPYAEAVAAYIDAAGQQLKAIRETIDAITEKSTDETKRNYGNVYRGLDRCDGLVRELKAATPQTFDLRKATFERVRGEMVKDFETAQRAG